MNRRILIVDDEQGIRAALGQLLEFEGYEVRTVANAGSVGSRRAPCQNPWSPGAT